ncbi:hypothetical protein CPB83DRAFT_846682 [Crepidotus variabilis]|uniref:Uncharacterized protein n=1 Tax=Crepidotus variabilis TaxID=179855 RepID=A0A9P6EQB9_9AGAR|nr:hypothetical protein CPB83DRAFT_846682 [Crepidotus variabilis]
MAVEPLLATRAQRAFMGTKAIIVIAMIATTFAFVDEHVKLRSNARYQTLPCYLALFGLAEVFELFMAFDALRMRNVIQLVGLLFFHLALLIFAALQIGQTKTALVTRGDDCTNDFVGCGGPGTLWAKVEPYLIVAPCIIAASWISMLFFIKKLYSEFGYLILTLEAMYQYYQVLICLLKFDFFFFAGVTMQLLILVLQRDTAEFGVTIAAVPVVLALLILCGIAVQREIKWIMTVSLVLMLAASSYFFKLYRYYSPKTQELYVTTRGTLTVFTIIAFLMLITSFIIGIRCYLDFDHGLQYSKTESVPTRPALSGYSSNNNMAEKPNSTSGAPLGRRISIE